MSNDKGAKPTHELVTVADVGRQSTCENCALDDFNCEFAVHIGFGECVGDEFIFKIIPITPTSMSDT